MLQSMEALIMIETSSSANSYGLLTRNTAVGEEEDGRCEAPPTGRRRAHGTDVEVEEWPDTAVPFRHATAG
jgi:hypothetical protein